VGPHTISVPRICPAEDITLDEFPDVLPDDIFCRIIAVIRLAVPYTGMIISTRESQSVRAKVLDLGVSQISGGSRTSVCGYTTVERHDETAQFDVSDTRTLDEVINWLLSIGYLPSFCTACYRSGRTGDRFMALCKAGKIGDICTPNALMTLKEYLMDFASEDTVAKGNALIEKELAKMTNERVREIAAQHINDIAGGQRDFYF
jgi:2-iminoacetate synthase